MLVRYIYSYYMIVNVSSTIERPDLP